MIVFDKTNAEKSTFDVDGGIIKPTKIKGGLYILHDELESIIKSHDDSIVYETRDVLKTEFITKL